MTTPLFVAAGTGTNVNGTASIPRPTVVSGDLMLLFVELQNSNESITPPSGWTLIDSYDTNDAFSAEFRVYWKLAGGSEPSTYSLTLSGANHVGGAFILSYDGTTVDQTTPIATHAVTAVASSTTIGCPSIVAPNDSTVLVYYGDKSTQGNATGTPPSGFTNRMVHRPTLTALKTWVDDKAFATGATTGTLNATLSVAAPCAVFTFAINGVSAADTTAPVLTSPTGTTTGATTASGTVVTDEGNGTLYFYASTNATETAATVKASGGTQAISSTGSKSVSFTGLTSSTVYYAHYVHRDTAGNDSARVSSASFTTSASDTTAPVLTSPTGTATGTTTASGTVVTDEANGTLYSLASTNATETAATVKASGATQTITTTGSKSASFTGLTASTTYYAHYVHRDAAGNDSTRVSSASFTTSASDTTAPVLTSPTGAQTSSSTGSGTVTTDEANGTLYSIATTNATETAAYVKTNGATQTISSTGSKSATFTGLTPSTVYYAHYVHRDAAGNDSTRVSSASFTTPAAGDTTLPVHTGSITPGAITTTTLAFTYPAATDNVAVTGYEISKDGGSNWVANGTGLSGSFTGLTSGTAYPIRVRAFDAAGNRSTPALALTMTTTAAGAFVSNTLVDGDHIPRASLAGWKVFIHNVTTGALIATKSSLTTNSSGVLSYSDDGCAIGTNYRHIYVAPDGTEGMRNQVAV